MRGATTRKTGNLKKLNVQTISNNPKYGKLKMGGGGGYFEARNRVLQGKESGTLRGAILFV